MTQEEALQAAIDEIENAWPDRVAGFARMVLADYLQEVEDPRAEGYRALGRLGRRPAKFYGPISMSAGAVVELDYRYFRQGGRWYEDPKGLPSDWHQEMENILRSVHGERSRRVMDDAAALAWLRLHPKRRESLMKRVP